VLRHIFFADRGGGTSPSSFFTQTLDAPDEPGSFFGMRRQVLCVTEVGACKEPMMMSLA
jgi:hypothetical protein